MTLISPDERSRLEALDRPDLEAYQIARLNALLEAVLPGNRFYATQLAAFKPPLRAIGELAALPFTFKEQLLGTPDDAGLAANRTWPIERYVRFHQTSGTRGRPLAVLDTADDWRWWLDCWQYVYDAAGVTAGDVVLMAFSFGPFVGFWSAYDAAAARGCLVVPGGGLSSVARLELIRTSGAAVICCTPSYALHLAEVAASRQIDAAKLGVRVLIVSGEPGGSIDATRSRIAEAWQARVFDHGGATEVGPWGFADEAQRGLHVNEAEFIAEFLAVDTGRPAGEGDLSELVLTTLGRAGSPVVRYRTGDLVRPIWNHGQQRRFVLLEGGVLGRRDDMLIVRGVNVFPSAVEQIVRSFPEVVEYRMTIAKVAEMDQLLVEIEDHLHQPARVADELRVRLGLKIEVRAVAPGTLPRFEGKSRRIVDQRAS